jgi:uncharacterized coiled-coil protein SlyX
MLNPISEQTSETEKIVKVLEVVEGGFVCEKWEKYEDNISIVIYGKEVDDFHSVDKDQLGIMALKGVQELNVIIKEQDVIIKEQEQIISSLQDQVSLLTTKLTETNNRLTQLINKLDIQI